MRELSQEDLRKIEASLSGPYKEVVWLIPKYEYGSTHSMSHVLKEMGLEVEDYPEVPTLLIVIPPKSWTREIVGYWTYIRNDEGMIGLFAYYRNFNDCYLKLPR